MIPAEVARGRSVKHIYHGTGVILYDHVHDFGFSSKSLAIAVQTDFDKKVTFWLLHECQLVSVASNEDDDPC